jgi:hypothetical protein
VSPVKRHPDVLTAHLASGGALDGSESAWVRDRLAHLRAAGPAGGGPAEGPALAELKRIYTSARVIQGAIVAARLALPALIDVGEAVRGMALPEAVDRLATQATSDTELFLTGSNGGRPRKENDYPAVVKKYIAAIAGILSGPFGKAYEKLRHERPDLFALAWDADELQRLCWGHMRLIIDQRVPGDEVAAFRSGPLREATADLLALVRVRTGVQVPARIMQRDDWQAAVDRPRQEPRVALFNARKFFVENAEVGISYCLGTLLVRMGLGESPNEALAGHIRYGSQDIAAGTHMLTHSARFQSRIGARPNDYRSYSQFLNNAGRQLAGASLAADRSIAWPDHGASKERGWCPARNNFAQRGSADLSDLAARGNAAVSAWRQYGLQRFGTEPVFTSFTAAQLFGATVLFVTMHDESPLRPDSGLLQAAAAQLMKDR